MTTSIGNTTKPTPLAVSENSHYVHSLADPTFVTHPRLYYHLCSFNLDTCLICAHFLFSCSPNYYVLSSLSTFLFFHHSATGLYTQTSPSILCALPSNSTHTSINTPSVLRLTTTIIFLYLITLCRSPLPVEQSLPTSLAIPKRSPITKCPFKTNSPLKLFESSELRKVGRRQLHYMGVNYYAHYTGASLRRLPSGNCKHTSKVCARCS